MSERRVSKIPILSMLDLFLGTFGAMIVIAVLVTFLRTQETRISQSPLYFIMLQIVPADDSLQVDLSQVFFEFDFTENGTSKEMGWSPISWVGGDSVSVPDFIYASANKHSSSSAIRLPIQLVQEVASPGLIARLQNISSLRFDQTDVSLLGQSFRISLVIQTAFNACGVEDIVLYETLIAADAVISTRAPSIFSLLAKDANGRRILCTFTGNTDGQGEHFEVKDGILQLNLDNL